MYKEQIDEQMLYYSIKKSKRKKYHSVIVVSELRTG